MTGVTEPFRLTVRVYYEDTDCAGVVYYANYLRFMERARTEWLAAIGFPLVSFEREHQVAFVVHRLEIDYHRPARLLDTLEVSVVPDGLRATRLVAHQQVRRQGEVLTDARVTLACIDTVRWRPTRIPAPLRQRLEAPA